MARVSRVARRLAAAGGRFAGAAALLLLAGCAVTAPPGAEAPPKILVAGGSGRVGIEVVQQLRSERVPLRALTRSRERALERWGEEFATLDWVEADVRDPEQVRVAMPGIERVICVIGTREVAGPNSAEFVDYGGVRNLVDAARAAGVRHFVLLTAIGTTDPEHPFNKFTKGALQWRFKGEEHLRDSGLDYTVVRPGGIVDGAADELGVALLQGDDWKPLLRKTIRRTDLAAVLVEAARNPSLRNVTLEVVNDESLPPGAWRASLSELEPDPAR